MFENKPINKHEFSNNINDKFLLVGDAKIPQSVQDKINGFRSDLYIIAKNCSGEPTLKEFNDIIKILEHYILPEGFKITKPLDKSVISNMISEYGEKLNDTDFVWYKWLLMNAGFLLSSVLPTSLDEDSLTIPEEIQTKRRLMIDEFKRTNDKHQYNKNLQELAKETLAYFTKTGNALGDFLNSKANGSLDHIQELLLGIGFALNAKGEIVDTITNCLVEGVSQTDYFSNSSQAIQALHAKSHGTAAPGYLGKRLSNVCEKVKLGEDDCGTSTFLTLRTKDADYLKTWVGRTFKTNKTGWAIFNKDDVKKYLDEELHFRDPLFCRSKTQGTVSICKKCYDIQLIQKFQMKEGHNIGLLTSTGILGSLINLTLKKSHTEVSLGLVEVDLTKDLI